MSVSAASVQLIDRNALARTARLKCQKFIKREQLRPTSG
jgi:hypothetical protein